MHAPPAPAGIRKEHGAIGCHRAQYRKMRAAADAQGNDDGSTQPVKQIHVHLDAGCGKATLLRQPGKIGKAYRRPFAIRSITPGRTEQIVE